MESFSLAVRFFYSVVFLPFLQDLLFLLKVMLEINPFIFLLCPFYGYKQATLTLII